jgi:RimJ/RimL family protein N-acetyltransferase
VGSGALTDGERRPIRVRPAVELRPATDADADLLLDWANDPVTRAAGFHPALIDRGTHIGWLAARLASPKTRIWIGMRRGRDGEPAGQVDPVGQVRLEVDERGVAEVGIAVAPRARGQGVGGSLLDAGLAAARADSAFGARRFLARVRPDNAASVRLFRAAGFAEVSRDRVNGIDCLVFERD